MGAELTLLLLEWLLLLLLWLLMEVVDDLVVLRGRLPSGCSRARDETVGSPDCEDTVLEAAALGAASALAMLGYPASPVEAVGAGRGQQGTL